jgi:hypothetical protein
MTKLTRDVGQLCLLASYLLHIAWESDDIVQRYGYYNLVTYWDTF